MSRARVLIADDHEFVRDGLVNLLQQQYEIVAAVSDGNALVESALRLRPDVIVTDISMPGLNGIEALDRLKTEGLDVRVIFLTLHVDAELAAALVRSGASGFVVKLAAPTELAAAIEAVLQGRVYVSPGLSVELSTRPVPP